jgi:holin-like protein
MLPTITLLLTYQLVGELLVIYFGISVPGPVIGMALLFISLCIKDMFSSKLRSQLNTNTNDLLRHLSLLFVPAGTGIMLHFTRIATEWAAILLALSISTALALAVTALTMRFLMHMRGGHR